MLNSTINSSSTPLSDIKGDNASSLPMNTDQSESSTGDSNPIGEFSKYNEEPIEPKSKNNYNIITGKKKNRKGVSKNEKKILNKKTKRNKNQKIKNGKIKNGKLNIIINIFNEFKTSSLYNKFPQFHLIDKNVKNELYPSSLDLAKDVRKIFSIIFSSYLNNLDYSKYNQALILCDYFEKIYKKHDCDSLTKKCKNLFDDINRLKKEIHKLEVHGSATNGNSGKAKKYVNKNETIVKKYKDDILCNIKKLNGEQKKGILKIISNNLIDKNIENNVIEFDINKIPINQLKMLDKYINQCINNNKIIINNIDKKCDNIDNTKIFEEEKQNNIFQNDDDLSSLVSYDDYDEDDLD